MRCSPLALAPSPPRSSCECHSSPLPSLTHPRLDVAERRLPRAYTARRACASGAGSCSRTFATRARHPRADAHRAPTTFSTRAQAFVPIQTARPTQAIHCAPSRTGAFVAVLHPCPRLGVLHPQVVVAARRTPIACAARSARFVRCAISDTARRISSSASRRLLSSATLSIYNFELGISRLKRRSSTSSSRYASY